MDFEAAVKFRNNLKAFFESNPAGQEPEMRACAADVVYWVNRWCWTYDPREPDPIRPFNLFPKQEEFLNWLVERDAKQESGLAEKSRDVGFTWLCTVYAVHCWLFRPADSTGFGSRKLDLVDHRNNPDSLFEKIRFTIKHLPGWMIPRGFVPSKHDTCCTLVNPANDSTITGEGGFEIGRGGRKSRYFLDEAAFLPRPKMVDAALSQTTRVRIDVSTPNGTGNPFHTRRFNGSVPVFTFHWRDDPRKDDAWYEREKIRISDPVIIAQELDIDYSASIENVVIPADWVRSAIDLDIPISGYPVAGWDVADSGRCQNVLVCRHGPRIIHIHNWRNECMLDSVGKVLRLCGELGVHTLFYDSIGVGTGVGGIARSNALYAKGCINLVPVNVGSAPTGSLWPDGISSADKFRNLRAELWWMVRARFEKAHSYAAAHAKGEPFSAYYPNEMISVPNHPELIAQLSLPIYMSTEQGKVQIESKDDMRRRGIESPDFADALVLAFHNAAIESALSTAAEQIELAAVHQNAFTFVPNSW
jgi:phage terminase large subunit